ncbi:MAG: tRNA lysidine(34) synthetase TilS [Candidatus Sumerlaeaceae bacterium]|nr:tRNA lysidine(34) synthetase TilS [Candidatus Sumerlaeaceae bacterium]
MRPAQDHIEGNFLSVELFDLDATPPTLYIAAVSGGPDSLAMLLASAELAQQGRIALECCYVDHGIRPAAGEREALFVESTCSRLGVVFHHRKLPPVETAPNVGSFEAKLRHLRYECLNALCIERGAKGILLGHTKDDLVETYLMNLVRGAGLRSAAFYPKRKLHGIWILRPLWCRSRQEIMEFLHERGVMPLEDETNRDLRFTRNKIRHELVPFLERELNPNVRDTLFHSAAVLQDAYRYLQRHARALCRAARSRATTLDSALNVDILRSASQTVRREALAFWLEKLLGKRVLQSRSNYEAVEKLLYAQSSRVVVLGRNVVIARVGDDIVACSVSLPPSSSGRHWRQTLNVRLACDYLRCHKELLLASLGGQRICLVEQRQESDSCDLYRAEVKTLDGKTRSVEVMVPSIGQRVLYGPLWLRNRKSGDRITPNKSLKEFFVDKKVPFFLKDFIVLVVDAKDRPVAIVGWAELNSELQKYVDVARSWRICY